MKKPKKLDVIATDSQDNGFLEINEPEVSTRFAELLPADLAYRYQALPVARNGDKITVAMADPSNEEARKEILAALGPSTCVVKARAQAIDKLLAEFWGSVGDSSPNFLYWESSNNTTSKEESYGKALSDLLGAHLNHFKTKKTGNKAYRELNSEIEQRQAEMLILGAIDTSILKTLIKLYSGPDFTDRIPASLLMINQPRWPLKSILLILRNETTDETAIDWTVRIAQPSKAKVAILPLIIAVQDLLVQDLHMNSSIAALLTLNCTVGRNIRSVACRLVDSDISGTIVLRQELPVQQIHFELMERNYDLVVISTELRDHRKRLKYGNLIKLLMSRSDLPVLVTKPPN